MTFCAETSLFGRTKSLGVLEGKGSGVLVGGIAGTDFSFGTKVRVAALGQLVAPAAFGNLDIAGASDFFSICVDEVAETGTESTAG